MTTDENAGKRMKSGYANLSWKNCELKEIVVPQKITWMVDSDYFRKLIGARKLKLKFVEDNMHVMDKFDWSVIPYINELLEGGVTVQLTSGASDYIIPI